MTDYTELVNALRGLSDWSIMDYEDDLSYAKQIVEEAADAIDKLQQIAGHYEECAKDYFKDVNYYLERMPRWIPVEEKPLREVGDDGYTGYLVYANGYISVADYTVDKYDNTPYFHVDGEYEANVTHWMPLPEPPKEET